MTPAPGGWQVRRATAGDAAALAALTRLAFTGQEQLDPPSGATAETDDDVAAWIAGAGGLVATGPDSTVVGAAGFSHQDGGFWLRGVAVRPDLRGRGVAAALIAAGEDSARRLGHEEVRVGVRATLVDNLAFWRRRGFVDHAEHGFWVELRRPLPVVVRLPRPSDTQALGTRLAALLRAGDLVLLSGQLGAGKTTLAQGIGLGLGVRGPVTSPTFVIARVHPGESGGPPLVHVDAYRLSSLEEVDDLDLDATVGESVTVVEWGQGKVEALADDRLEVTLLRPSGDSDETRTATVRPVGPRWAGVSLAPAAQPG